MCSARTLAGRAAKGKVRHGAAFYVAGPTHESPGRCTFGAMYALLQQRAPEETHLVPDVLLSSGGWLDDKSDIARRQP
eukprot:7423495-Pyramimonas_sp.AAC.1